LRPLAPPGQEQDSAGHGGHYLVIKRLMPLFEQRAPAEMTAALRAQLEAPAPLTTKETRDRDGDDLVRRGNRPGQKAGNRGTNLPRSIGSRADFGRPRSN